MEKPILYTTGYLGERVRGKSGKIAAFDAMVRRVGLLVCDIRLNPYSKAECWRKANLESRLGAGFPVQCGTNDRFPDSHYLHVPQLGNRNYKSGGPVSIVHLSWGVETIMDTCRACGLAPLLLCGCEDVECCHREEVGMGFANEAHQWFEILQWDDPSDLGYHAPTSGTILGVELTEKWAGQ